MNRLFIVILLFFSLIQQVNCQLFQEEYRNREDTSYSSVPLLLDLQASTWFYNNEYFNPFYKGYTLTGAYLQPWLVYRSNNNLKISAGTHIQRFYGDHLNTKIQPLFSIEYRPSPYLTILMGSFNGGENHRMNDVLFSFENHLTDLPENGILINIVKPWLFSETWLNWEEFIQPGDTIQEQFTAGSSNSVRLFENSSWKISIPFQLLAHHAGGQINITNKKVVTLINIGEGIKISRIMGSDHSKNVYAEVNLFHSVGDFKPSSGKAVSAKTGFQSEKLELNLEYFSGNDFISFAGNPLFRSMETSIDPFIPFLYGGSNEMINFKAGYRQKIGKNSLLFLRFEGYYLTSFSKPDYSYSLHFQVRDFLKLLLKNP